MSRKLAYRAPLLGALLSLALCACASAPQPSRDPAPVELRELPEPAALSLLDRLLLEQRELPIEGWKVRLSRTELDVDLRLGESRFGIEWVSPRDRELYGPALPAPDPDGQLRLLRGDEPSEPPLILLLDHSNYRLALSAHESSAQSERELEDRLRRDLNDFLAYARSQHAE